MRLVAVATAALLPGGARQERTLNAIPFLARHGVALLDEMSVPAREHAAALIEPRNHDPGLVVGGPPVAP